ncbi:M23 family metallopeptidase [Aridibaculum aurantiacum]|uniref:M23 family metallopeptidase n=1 Tax=Aridibaculum aurantiacum TaxID=2810307 RepID=UPI001A9740F5|nr:M23 family metallopeptidase [Aridibaculum aurantiacum]
MKKLLLLLFTCSCYFSYAQLFPPVNYPSNYFRNPMGIPLQLSANFGELRTNHYHMGFDIRTNQRENLPVYAAAEGYISRIKIERYGYGRAIYINHPNGYTTLYAHLNDFYPALNSYVINKQYADEQWEQDITFAPGQFPVTKGQFIAYSGNTGGSAGPHLHFEIRDTKTEVNINPWLFNFGLPDNIPPVIYQLYYYDRRFSTYQVGPKTIPIRKAGQAYSATSSVVSIPTSTFSLGISAEDKTNTSPFMFGIYQAEVYIDDTARFGFRLSEVSYNETRAMNGAIDFKTKYAGGRYIQHLSRLPGNNSNIFATTAGDGVYIFHDTLVHNAEIRVRDVAGNLTTVRFRFRYDPSGSRDIAFSSNSIPMLPNQVNQLMLNDIQVSFPASSFYHLVPFVHVATAARDMVAASKIHSLHTFQVPVHDSFTVKIRSDIPASDPRRDKIVMQLVNPRKTVATKGPWDGDWMTAKFWDLGEVRLLVDTIPPTITGGFANNANLAKSRSIAFTVKDNAGEIRSFRAELDGKWLMFRRRDYAFIHDFDERTTPGRHDLRIIVEDEAGNVTERRLSFSR